MNIGQTFVVSPDCKYSREKFKIIAIENNEILANPTQIQQHHIYKFSKDEVELAINLQ